VLSTVSRSSVAEHDQQVPTSVARRSSSRSTDLVLAQALERHLDHADGSVDDARCARR